MGTKGETADQPANLSKKLHENKSSNKVISIPGRTPGDRLRIGALAWSQYEQSEQRWITDQELTQSVTLVSKKLQATGAKGIAADIIICSGAAVWSDRRRAGEDLLARELTAASGGIPILVEWKDDEDGPAEWYLADGDRWRLVRNCQYFSKSNETYSKGHEVLKEIDSGFGRIRVQSLSGNASAELVLLLCNEARLLQKTTADGLFADIKKRPKSLPDPFHGDWFLLHPSHRPYANSRQAGVGLVASWYKPSTGSIMEAVFAGATSGATYGDGSRAPRAIVHAGPFSPLRKSDRSVATIAFAEGKVVAPSTPNGVPVTVSGLVQIKYAEFEFTLGGVNP